MNFRNLFILVLVPLCFAFVLQSLRPVGSQDSIAYWSAVQAFVHGENPYDLNTLLTIQRSVIPNLERPQFFLNPPWIIPLLLPLFCWNFETSTFLLLAINIFITLFTLRKMGELVGPLAPSYMILVGAFFPIVSCWYLGQLSCFLMLGTILSLQWVVQSYKPWWKIGVALVLLSIKPQTVIILGAALLGTTLRRLSRRDILKIASLALAPISFLAYYSTLLGWWGSSFTHSTRWVTSSLPSLMSSALSSRHELMFLMLPAAFIGAFALVFERRGLTPYRFVLYMLISPLFAPYAWVFDFSPFVIITYAIAVVVARNPVSEMKRWSCIAVLVALCLPFEALFTYHLEAYAIHPLLVAVLFLCNRRDIHDLFKRMELNRA